MFELVAVGVLGVVLLLVLGMAGVVLAFVGWAVVLPFKILGAVVHGVGAILWPILALVGFVLLFAFGLLGALFALPVLPLVVIGLGVWWLARRRPQPKTVV